MLIFNTMADYKPKNILITGGAGFIASHVVIRLVKNYPEYNIINFDKLDYCSSLKNLESIERFRNYKFVEGNILSPDLVRYILESEKIDTILHFAAQTHVDNSFGNSIVFTENNVKGTHNLLEATRAYGKIGRFVHVSTDEVYGEVADDAEDCQETAMLAPTNPYAATKAAAEFIVKAYHKSFGIPTLITRGNNVYGPHQFPEKLVPKFICLLQDDKKIPVHGTGMAKRNFIFAEDVASAFDVIMHKGEVDHIYNVGADDEMSVLEVARELIKVFGKDESVIEYTPDRAFNDARYAIDSTALKNLGWKCEIGWKEGLQKTIEWYKKYRGNWDAVELALKAHPTVLYHVGGGTDAVC